ncbi:ATP-dependent DNA ligase [Cupriavidus sp. RAF12]|uniref:ATP-dependent DNA ligase n=1 Tax=Cupriavidus sp. RAF12 TaxID=3233050 RepID=UPI003F8E80B9
MLLVERKAIPRDEDWLYEIKFDGYRVLASTGSSARLRSRGGADATRWFPEVVAAMADMASGSILDGEVCVLDEFGRSDFNRLHARARRKGWYEGADLVVYCVFDVLVAKGKDIRSSPLEIRKATLAKLLRAHSNQVLHVTGVEDGEWLYRSALDLELEGVVGKRLGSPYLAGVRSPDWIKVKRPGAVPPERFKR